MTNREAAAAIADRNASRRLDTSDFDHAKVIDGDDAFTRVRIARIALERVLIAAAKQSSRIAADALDATIHRFCNVQSRVFHD